MSVRAVRVALVSEDVNDAPSELNNSHQYDVYSRVFDIILSTILLLITFPVFLAVAIAILLDSPGPVLFIQSRAGKNGHPFAFYKFRSMCIDAEFLKAGLQARNECDGPLFKIRHDPRMTRVGRLIRRWSLDELPQLINVLKGDMSLVGPRPAVLAEVAQYSSYERRRLSVTPGITGLWQVSGRSDLPFTEAVQLDLVFAEERSIALYVQILARTIPAVLSARGAY